MDKSRQIDYARRITQANRTELVVVTYDILLEELDGAAAAAADKDTDGYRAALKQAQKFLGALMSALDFRYELSVRLMSLYEYVQRILVASDISGEDRGLAAARKVIGDLRSSFVQVAAQDDSEPLMENTQTVFAGLTYGRGSLNETDIDPAAAKRGFLA